MGIPAEYNDKDNKRIIPSVPPVNLMLLVPKAQKALQECFLGEPERDNTDQL
jgi:hypothetical protein